MSFLTRLFNVTPKTEKRSALNDYKTTAYNNLLSKGGSSFDSRAPELCSTIYTSIGLIANNLSKLDLHVYHKTSKGREVYKDHPWETSLSINPDLRLSTSKWLAFVVTQMLIEGESYHLKSDFDPESLQLKRELKPLGQVDKVASYDGEIFYKFKNVELWIPSKSLLTFHYFSKDGVTGISPIKALRNELDIQKGSEQTITNFYRNGLFQLLYLEQDTESVGTADKKKLQEYYEKIENEVTGSYNAFKGGLLKLPPMYKLKSLTLPDLKFLESSKFTESRIAAIYNIPAYMLNVNEGAGGNYSKVEAQQLHFLNNCLSNIINIIRQELKYKILTVEEIQNGVDIDFDYSKLFTVDLESKSLYFKNMQSMGAVSVNEIREAFSYPIIDSEFANYNWIQKQNAPIQLYNEWDGKATDNNTAVFDNGNNNQQNEN